MNATHYPDPDPLYVPEPGTDDEPWDPTEPDRSGDGAGWRVLAVLIVALVVVAIVWRR